MDQQQVIDKLNWFYSLELSQVDLYMAQSKKMDDFYFEKVFEHAAYVEQQHVDDIAKMIKELGGEPTMLGDAISPILGKIGGNVISAASILPMLKANILLEQEAMSSYKDFISMVNKDTELYDLLWSNLIDEDFHVSWFSKKVQELEKTH